MQSQNIVDDDLLNFLYSIKKPTSYFAVKLGVGNKVFSVNNNSINSSQTEVNTTATYTKQYLQPSLSLGYNAGNFKEINTNPVQIQNRIVYVKYSTNNN